MRQALEVLKTDLITVSSVLLPKMPTPSQIAICGANSAVDTIKNVVLPPIVAELKQENADLKERLRKLEELVQTLTKQT